jgi:hypothetical protein
MDTEDRARQVQSELEDALAAVADQARITERLARARAAEAAAQATTATAREKLADAAEDVQALESFSPTRIWATLRGSRDTDLDQEQAEHQAAQYEVARAEAFVHTAQEEVRRAEAELTALGDVAARREAALAAKEEWLTAAGGGASEELARIAGDLGLNLSQSKEVREALAAGDGAARYLDQAARLLDSAGGWATYDTFFGGGMLTDAMKYDRMDQAQRLLHEADRALKTFASELADVGLQVVVRGLTLDGLTQAFDFWFDNIFTDWAVKDRISEASRRTGEAIRVVAELRARLAHEDRELTERRADLVSRRERLLGA